MYLLSGAFGASGFVSDRNLNCRNGIIEDVAVTRTDDGQRLGSKATYKLYVTP